MRKRKVRKLKLLPHQLKFLNLRCQYPGFVGGYGAGKSTTLVARALQDAIANPNGAVGIFAPTYDLLDLVLVSKFEETFEQFEIPYTFNKQKHIIKAQNMGALYFRSLDHPKRIVGFEVCASHIDELDTLPKAKAKESWEKVLGRTRLPSSTGQNPTCIYTTPEGRAFVWEKWGKSQDPKYQLVRARSIDNPFLPEDFVDNLKADYPEELVNAYVNGEFCSLTSGTVYYAYNRDLNHTPRRITDHDHTLHVGIDFNIQHMSASIGVDDGLTIEVLEEISDAYDTADVIRILKERYGDRRKIIIYPDASSGNRSTSSSDTDLALLKRAFTVKRSESNPLIRDRVNVVNGLLCNAQNERRLLINADKCPRLAECLESQAYDPHTGQPDKKAGFDHQTDSLGYLIFGLRAERRRSVQSSGIRIY